MIYYIEKGDVFKIPQIKNYAHGCNCVGAMGKGIALQFRNKYPQMYEQYHKLCKEGLFKVGSVFVYHYDNGVIYNLGTQKSWKEKAEIEYIRDALCNMMVKALEDGVRKIAMPAIGAGLGGANWNEIKHLLNAISSEYPAVDLYVVEQYCDKETPIYFIRKQWNEENIIFLLHFVGDDAVRQIEIYPEKIICLSLTEPINNNSILYDQSLQNLDLSPSDFIREDYFENLWQEVKESRVRIGRIGGTVF